jgi:hypothetical protein
LYSKCLGMARNTSQLNIPDILRWADAHYKRAGKWPNYDSGSIPESLVDTWGAVHYALYHGFRGFPGRDSLAKLLQRERGVRNKGNLPKLTISKILAWADAHHRRTKHWPNKKSGPIVDAPDENWRAVGLALYTGGRGLQKGTTLARLLSKRRGVRTSSDLPRLSIPQILEWIDIYHDRTGKWPNRFSRSIRALPGVKWSTIEAAQYHGTRGLPGHTTLPKLLAKHRGVRNRGELPKLSIPQIVHWAELHKKRTGHWPTQYSGEVIDAPEETWSRIGGSFRHGHRGLSDGTSLARVLAEHCGRPNKSNRPKLSEAQVLRWADGFHRDHKRWPRPSDGPVEGVAHETWSSVHAALARGLRGIGRRTSLGALLKEHRGIVNRLQQPKLSIAQILEWADAYLEETGRWPDRLSGSVKEMSTTTWNAVDIALYQGSRGLPGGDSIARLLAKHRGRRNQLNPPRLSHKLILQWADHHFEQTGEWPSRESGPILADRQEKWYTIEKGLQRGARGLPGGWTLVRLLSTHRKSLYRRRGIPLSVEDILEWATIHHELTGALPTPDSGPVRDHPGEHWKAIDAALRAGTRNLRGKSSLNKLFAQRYEEPYPGIGQPLTTEKIVKWARDFRKRVGRWPTKRSAFVTPPKRGIAVREVGERWAVVDIALHEGLRGLPGGSSLKKLLRMQARKAS